MELLPLGAQKKAIPSKFSGHRTRESNGNFRIYKFPRLWLLLRGIYVYDVCRLTPFGSSIRRKLYLSGGKLCHHIVVNTKKVGFTTRMKIGNRYCNKRGQKGTKYIDSSNLLFSRIFDLASIKSFLLLRGNMVF